MANKMLFIPYLRKGYSRYIWRTRQTLWSRPCRC